jgi:flagellar hook assembly protein FlgD
MSIGFQSIEWDGQNEYGKILANGVYIYKINAKNNSYNISHIGRCVIFN